jgi:8-oxo-dGTP diphosphatase
VREETGYTCAILAAVPGTFESDTCVTRHFLMVPTGDPAEFDQETSAVRWVSPEAAFDLIQPTRTTKGRSRDAGALTSAIGVWTAIHAAQDRH